MKILIDADGCPVVALSIKIANEYGINTVVISDFCHLLEFDNELTEVVMVDKGADSADFVLVNRVCADDIVITQDYGLAAMCLSKNACVINQNGLIYNNENIDSLLLRRHINKKIRRGGGRTTNAKKRTTVDNESFELQLRKLIENRC